MRGPEFRKVAEPKGLMTFQIRQAIGLASRDQEPALRRSFNYMLVRHDRRNVPAALLDREAIEEAGTGSSVSFNSDGAIGQLLRDRKFRSGGRSSYCGWSVCHEI